MIPSWVNRAYYEIEAALWASLVAALIFFAVFVAPKIAERRAVQDQVVAQELEKEHAFYCSRWKFVPNTHEYDTCVTDLQNFRQSAIARYSRENEF